MSTLAAHMRSVIDDLQSLDIGTQAKTTQMLTSVREHLATADTPVSLQESISHAIELLEANGYTVTKG